MVAFLSSFFFWSEREYKQPLFFNKEDLRHFLGANVVPFAMHRGLWDLARRCREGLKGESLCLGRL